MKQCKNELGKKVIYEASTSLTLAERMQTRHFTDPTCLSAKAGYLMYKMFSIR